MTLRVCDSSSESVIVPDDLRVKVIGITRPIQGKKPRDTCTMVDCPNCGHTHLIDKVKAGNYDLYCFGKWIPISIETII